MIEKYLIYIDMLGFSDLVYRAPHEIDKIYAILDSLNVHEHEVFRSIVFSDTALVYNRYDPSTPADEDYIVWYSIEFVEDLQHRLVGQDIYFRALITRGLFKHYELKNVECFFGRALVDAYKKEKRIPSIGLFIDSRSNKHNHYFRTAPLDEDLNFVYLNRDLESFHCMSQSEVPFEHPCINDDFPFLAKEIRYLKDIHYMMRHHKDPIVRVKYLSVWDFYLQRYPNILGALESNMFDLRCLSKNYDWSTQLANVERDINYFKNIAV